MKNGKPKNENKEIVFPYGENADPQLQEKSLKKILTILNGNPTVSSRLSNALGLKEIPGMPPVADMSRLIITTDMFQRGFANYEYINQLRVAALNILAIPAVFEIEYNIVSPAPRANIALPAAGTPLYINNDKDLRVNNAWFDYRPSVLNPAADTFSRALHCQFRLDDSIVFEQTQNNLVSSAADNSFVSQTADSSWNGIIPQGSTFRVIFRVADGATGAWVALNVGDAFGMALSAFAVPAGAEPPK